MRGLPTLLLFTATLCRTALAQNLPDEYRVTDDGRRLVAGDQPTTGLYEEGTIKAIHLTFAQDNWWTLLENSYDTGIPVMAGLSCNGVTYDSVGVRIKGETSYFMLPPGAEKVSLDINMDEFVPGQDLEGYESINLNNGFQDPTVMRDVAYHHLARPHIPAAKACFAKLYINGMNWGLYDLVQDLDGDFIREWWFSNDGARWRAQRSDGQMGGPWGDGTAALNYLGLDTNAYKVYYTLKNANTPEPWIRLVQVCAELNNTPITQLRDTLERYMDLDRVLWHLAVENAFADDDSYIYKGKSDYSLYWEPETGRMTTQEIDGNSPLGTQNLNWGPFYHADNPNYPLLNRLLQVPDLRQRYLAHMRTIITEAMLPANFLQLTNTYRNLIDTVVQNDPKKLMTYVQFNNGVNSLQGNLNTRRNNLLANAEVAQVGPAIGAVDHFVAAGMDQPPVAAEAASVRAAVSSGNGISAVVLHWCAGVWGRFARTPMYDDGAHDDGAAGDGTWGAAIPGQAAGTWVRYYVEARAANTATTASFSPAGAEHDVYVYQVATNNSPIDGVVINELMASNSATAMDGSGQYDDWIELYNGGNSAVDLQGWYLTDTPFEPTKWQLPAGTVMAPDSYMIVWADEDASQGDMHANFKLSASGESVLLYDADTALVDQVDFGQQVTDQGYARVPNGTGPFVIQAPTFGANNSSLGIGSNGAPATFRLYPNPAAAFAVVVWEGGSPQDVTLVDATGRTVLDRRMRSGERIEIDGLAPGAYVVRAGAAVGRLVVAR
jgi:hypothetical protein